MPEPVIETTEIETTPEPALTKVEREKEYWRGKAEGLAAVAPSIATPRAPVVEAPKPPPDPEPEVPAEPDYNSMLTPAEIAAAQTRYLRAQQRHDTWKDRQDRKEQDRQERAVKAAADKRQSAISSFEKQLEDESKVDDKIYALRDTVGARVTEHTARLLIESDVAPRLLRYFDSNPAELSRINSLPYDAAIKAVAKIELDATKGLRDDSGKVKVVSTTPNPLDTLNTGGSSTMSVDDPGDPDASSKMDIDNWVYKRNMQVHGMLQQAQRSREAARG